MKEKNYKKIPTNKGQAMIISVMFLLAGSLIIVGSASSSILKDIKILRNLEESKQSFSLSEGSVEDLVYRVKNGMDFSDTETLSVNGITATATTQILADKREVISIGDKNKIMRTIRALLAQGDGVSFNYGVQAGEGGIRMQNLSSVQGNIYSNGPITGQNSNITYGDIVSAGPGGLIDGVYVTGSGYAHTITDSEIEADAYYQNISNTSVGGVLYPSSADQATSTLPIPDFMIDKWKTYAENGGIINSPCPYRITSNQTLGPVKINCNLKITGSPTITLNGHIWVVGNISIENSADIKVSSFLGKNSVAMIADNPSNRLTSSKVEIENSAQFFGSGSEGSYVLVISQNNSAENGGFDKAVEVENNANGDLLIYAGHGNILLKNSVNLKEVTGYKITIQNNAQIVYETGLANLLFTSGPSGGFDIESWLEI